MRGAGRLLTLCVVLAGCRAEIAPRAPGNTILVVRGDRQRGFEQSTLGDSIVVAVKSAGGEPVGGTRVTFIASGRGSTNPSVVVSDARGIAATRWQLGDASAPQRLVATFADEPADGAGVTLEAIAVARRDADELQLLDANHDDARILFFDDAAIGAVERVRLDQGQTQLTLLPAASSSDRSGVAVFSVGHPPAVLDGIRWSDAPDTLRIRFRDAVDAPVAVWIVSRGVAKNDVHQAITDAAAIWRPWGVRLSVTDLDIHDVSADPAAELLRGPLAPCGGGPAVGFAQRRINVYVIDGIVGYAGYSCESFVMISRTRFDGRLWAHEIGHQFGLGHAASAENIMYPSGGGARIVEGQAFRAHMHTGSVLNTLFDAVPLGSRRDCNALAAFAVPVARTRCLPEDFAFER